MKEKMIKDEEKRKTKNGDRQPKDSLVGASQHTGELMALNNVYKLDLNSYDPDCGEIDEIEDERNQLFGKSGSVSEFALDDDITQEINKNS